VAPPTAGFMAVPSSASNEDLTTVEGEDAR
jgi:hypothetical protein